MFRNLVQYFWHVMFQMLRVMACQYLSCQYVPCRVVSVFCVSACPFVLAPCLWQFGQLPRSQLRSQPDRFPNASRNQVGHKEPLSRRRRPRQRRAPCPEFASTDRSLERRSADSSRAPCPELPSTDRSLERRSADSSVTPVPWLDLVRPVPEISMEDRGLERIRAFPYYFGSWFYNS